ncbi:MgtC/SapB family protein [Motiliproteus sediminis]|uniref:MgtC/SapB family protein n=1 Tax=Motiliproteus sediminis TaxID=1468178 RepID=UPI001AF022A2|nr:MgtC/SapB family protein [Motiliproteus sediminis]
MEQSLVQLLWLGSALAIGLLVGVERGWRNRTLADGRRVAGLRTFGLTGLLGGISGLLANQLGGVLLGLLFLGVAALATATYLSHQRNSSDVSATSLVAMLVTFLLGALAGMGQVEVAAACGVVTTLLLRSKRYLHRLLEQLSQRELNAALQLLVISLVLLPVLPNQGYGPWQALNPYEIWWMVVLIAAISFVGYFLIRIVGAQRGILLTGVAGGLLSSTALTLQLARLSKQQPDLTRHAAVGILIACAVMFPRVLLVAGLINLQLVQPLLWPLVAMLLVLLGWAALIMLRGDPASVVDDMPQKNPLELGSALLFGLLLGVVALLGRAAVEWMGESGVLLLAVASGIADVDAINLTLARMAGEDIVMATAVLGITLASVSNTLLKGVLALSTGDGGLARWVLLPLATAAAVGVGVQWMLT